MTMEHASGFLNALIHDTLVLFAMVNAVGNLPVFAELTSDLDHAEKRKVFNTAVMTAAGIVVAFAFFGNWMLQSMFQVDTGAFKVAGGVLVFSVAARGMIVGASRVHIAQSEPHGNLGVFPMGFPFLAGPGTIVTTILLMQTGGAAVTALAALLVYASVLPILHLTPVIQRAGGRVSMLVVSRILYIFIAAKAVTFVISGVKSCMELAQAAGSILPGPSFTIM